MAGEETGTGGSPFFCKFSSRGLAPPKMDELWLPAATALMGSGTDLGRSFSLGRAASSSEIEQNPTKFITWVLPEQE